MLGCCSGSGLRIPYSSGPNSPVLRCMAGFIDRAGMLGARPTQATAARRFADINAASPPMLQPIRTGGCLSCRPQAMSGHVVRGVVEGTGRIEAWRNDGDSLIMTCSAPGHLIQSMIERGPVCVDGVSLTVIAKTDLTFSVSLVDFTQAHTILLERRVGDPVNIETDIMMRYVSQALRARGHRPAEPARRDFLQSN